MAMLKMMIDEFEYDIERVRDYRKAAAKCEQAALECGGGLPAAILRRVGRGFRRAAQEQEQLEKLLRD